MGNLDRHSNPLVHAPQLLCLDSSSHYLLEMCVNKWHQESCQALVKLHGRRRRGQHTISSSICCKKHNYNNISMLAASVCKFVWHFRYSIWSPTDVCIASNIIFYMNLIYFFYNVKVFSQCNSNRKVLTCFHLWYDIVVV